MATTAHKEAIKRLEAARTAADEWTARAEEHAAHVERTKAKRDETDRHVVMLSMRQLKGTEPKREISDLLQQAKAELHELTAEVELSESLTGEIQAERDKAAVAVDEAQREVWRHEYDAAAAAKDVAAQHVEAATATLREALGHLLQTDKEQRAAGRRLGLREPRSMKDRVEDYLGWHLRPHEMTPWPATTYRGPLSETTKAKGA